MGWTPTLARLVAIQFVCRPNLACRSAKEMLRMEADGWDDWINLLQACGIAFYPALRTESRAVYMFGADSIIATE